MPKKNYYEVLGISQTATQEEIKNAYRNQAKQWHPDVNPDPNAETVMVTINAAYEVLSDLSLRQQYDAKLRQENRTTTTTTQSSPQSARPRQYSYYASYTRTREESEYDFDEWLKEYLKRERQKYNYADKENFIEFDIDLLNKLKDEILSLQKDMNSINTPKNEKNYKEDIISQYYGRTNYSFYGEEEKPKTLTLKKRR